LPSIDSLAGVSGGGHGDWTPGVARLQPTEIGSVVLWDQKTLTIRVILDLVSFHESDLNSSMHRRSNIVIAGESRLHVFLQAGPLHATK
jgi:hypothetical protein